MAERRTATTSGGRRPGSAAALPAKEVHQDTARISLHGGRPSELPGWFWGALGCLSVLAIGLSVLFLLVRPSAIVSPPTASAVVAPVGSAVPAPPPGGSPNGSRIQVEQIASPPPPALAPLPAPKPKAPPRAVKIARSPTATTSHTAEAAAAKEGSDTDETAKDDPPPPRKTTASAPREGRSREPASDDDSDEK